jgi:LysM repeat protein
MGGFDLSLRGGLMRLAPFATGLAVAAAIAVAGGPSAHAQSQNNQNDQKSNSQPQTVVVNPGDTLDGIATAHQTTYVRMYDANTNIKDPDLIYPGDNLKVPSAEEQLPSRPLPEDAAAASAPSTTQPAARYSPPAAAQPAAAAPALSATSSGCGDNQYAQFIYAHESGCRTTAMSPNGCYGIGQACPASKLAYCGADYTCQNAFFTAYAGKYGGWAGAYAFWAAHGWW